MRVSSLSARLMLPLAIVALFVLFAGTFAYAENSDAQPDSGDSAPAGIIFPIPELGNCASKAECKAYCDDSAHVDACLSFASKHKLMKSDEVAKARKFVSMKGPGGCQGLACKTYCEDTAHADECIKFAQEHQLISAKDVRIAQVIKEGGGPGGCASMSECWNYCADSAHMQECSTFAEENGLKLPDTSRGKDITDQHGGPGKNFDHPAPPEPQINKEKAQQVLAEKGGPGGCKTMEECGSYCDAESHMDECMRFAEENGLMDKEEVARVKKLVEQPGPGGCRGRACQTYCQDEKHADECTAFAVEHGFMSKEDAERVKKFQDITGPGGCRGEECKTYCEDPSHAQECMDFAIKNGFVSQEEIDRMKGMMEGPRHEGDGQPPESHDMMRGPGGCDGPESCRAYCSDEAHREECMRFMPPGQSRADHREMKFEMRDEHRAGGDGSWKSEGPRPEMRGPGGCQGPEECASYCRDHMDECRGFRGSMEMRESSSSPAHPPADWHLPSPMRGDAPQPPCRSFEECRALYENRSDPQHFDPNRMPPPQGGDHPEPPRTSGEGGQMMPPPHNEPGPGAPPPPEPQPASPPPPPPTSMILPDNLFAAAASLIGSFLGY